jgi:hypothetical protein
MARSKQDSTADTELEQLKELNNLSKDEQLRRILALERKVAQSDSKYKDLANKHKLVLSDLEVAEETVERFLATQDAVTEKKLARIKKGTKGQATAILCVNDWHLEENVEAETINGLNEFDLNIAEKRVSRLWERSLHLLEFARSVSNIKDLVVWLGGDLINGYIHEEAEETNFTGPTEAILAVDDYVATGLQMLLTHANVRSLTVVTSYGNHGRTTRKRRVSSGYKTSWEWLCYNNLAKYFRNEPKVTFKVGRGYHNWLPVQGHDIRFHHGDAVRFMGGVGGVHIPLRKKIAQWNKAGRTATLDCLGHFHGYSDDWYYVVCGCLVGYNAYAIEIGAEYQRPTQTFIVMDKQEAKVMALPLFLEKMYATTPAS